MNCREIKEKITIRQALDSLGIFPAKENPRRGFYFAMDREEKTPSFCVDFLKNTAFDFGSGRSFDIISIIQEVKKFSVSEALDYLEKLGRLPTIQFEAKEKFTRDQYKILQIREVAHPALLQYLESRKVLEQKHFLKEIHFENNSRKNFGLGFENNSGGFEIRNTYTKICLGRKDFTLIKSKENTNAEISVFEGFIDFLTYKNLLETDSDNCDFLILNSTAMLSKVQNILKDYQKISLFLDNDNSGKLTADKIRNNFKNVEDCSGIYQGCKDLNEWWCNR